MFKRTWSLQEDFRLPSSRHGADRKSTVGRFGNGLPKAQRVPTLITVQMIFLWQRIIQLTLFKTYPAIDVLVKKYPEAIQNFPKCTVSACHALCSPFGQPTVIICSHLRGHWPRRIRSCSSSHGGTGTLPAMRRLFRERDKILHVDFRVELQSPIRGKFDIGRG